MSQSVWDIPASRLGAASRLPRFNWQQPIGARQAPPSRGLSVQELAGEFTWGENSILPYAVYDDYDRSQLPGHLPVVHLENDRLRIAVAPQLGGRLLQLFDKRLRRELVFKNPAFQPANLAALNAWFSGGIEWNGLIPGHSPFTVAPVFCGVLETERGPVLRLHEFDRIVEATWQVDLFLPDGDDRLFVHGRIVNATQEEKQAYWWTNVAVPAAERLRVVAPADYVIEHVLPGNELARFPFPRSGSFDKSYPRNWSRSAPSVFFRTEGAVRPYIAALDKDGVGLSEASTPALRGRKFFYFGSGRGGARWMNHLSREGEGEYVEIQAGVTPTQNQRFDLPANSEFHWTEAFGALQVDPGDVHGAEYAVAERSVAAAIEARYPKDDMAAHDAFLAEVSRWPVTTRLASGSPWGRREERLRGHALAPGLDFVSEAPCEFWDDVAANAPSAAAYSDPLPQGFATSARWVAALERHREGREDSWRHDLMLGIAALDSGDVVKARELFDASLGIRKTWLGFRQRALVAVDPDEAESDYLAAWSTGDAPPEVAVEIVQFLIEADRVDALERFVSRLPEGTAAHERIVLARAVVAERRGDWDALEVLLGGKFATIREGETLTSDLWMALQRARQAQALGRAPNETEAMLRMTDFPVPEHLEFRMISNQGAT